MLTKEEPARAEQPSAKVEKQAAKPKPQEVELKPPSASPVVEYEDVSMERPRRRKGIIGIIVTLLLLAVLGGGFYYCWTNYSELFGIPMGASDRWLSIRNLEGQEIIAKEGTLFLVSGNVYNGSTKSRKFLILRAKLFDKEGKVLAEKDVLSGLPFSKDTIASMSKTDIEKKVNDFKLSSEDNFQAAKKKQSPFSIIFFDGTIDKAKEFTVEIVESPLL